MQNYTEMSSWNHPDASRNTRGEFHARRQRRHSRSENSKT